MQDYQAMLDDNLTINYSWPTLGEIASDGHYITNSTYGFIGNTEQDAYTWSHTYPYLQVQEWILTYKRVLYANLVLEGLANIQPSSEIDLQNWDNIKGEALFIRAMSIYEAAQLWAEPFDSATSGTDLGVPIRLSSNINVPAVRSTVQQDYSQVIADLLQAKSLLPKSALYLSRASKPAALALLARVYLNVGDYGDAGF